MRKLTTVLVLFISLVTGCRTPDLLDQEKFPCAEDEVVGFHPRFGPDKVGCLSIEELTQPTTALD